MYPRLVIDLPKLENNLNYLISLCHSKGLTCAIVTKVFCADEKIVELINNSKADIIADSRLINLRRVKTAKPKLLLRISALSEINEVLEFFRYIASKRNCSNQQVRRSGRGQNK